jgi:phospholipid transport system substrate-binding protein
MFASLLAWSPRALSDGSIDWAAAFIRQIGNEIADIADSPGSEDERRQRLQHLVDQVADVDDAARFCLGRFWHLASRPQQSQYVALFHTVLMKVVLARINAESQVRSRVHIAVNPPELRQEGVYVPTVVERGSNPPAQVTWVVRADPLHPRLIDVIAEGTSLRLTVRSDYYAFLTRHDNDIDMLLRALRNQACDDCTPR